VAWNAVCVRSHMCVCMCVRVSVIMQYACIISVCVFVWACMCACVYVATCVHVYVCIFICKYIYTYICIYVNIRMHMCQLVSQPVCESW